MMQLITDTLTYLHQEGYFLEKRVILEAPKPAPLPKPKPIVKEKPPVIEPNIPEKKQLAPTPLLFDAIQKHLPHIRLIQEIPGPQEVAIIVSDREELPFLKNLARAIQDRFCPVKLLPKETARDLDSFSLVLTQEQIEGIGKKKQILLAKADHYENNTGEKKNLWSQICQLLKSS